jgi:hypothetical protein
MRSESRESGSITLLWGDDAAVEERFGAEVVELNLFRRSLVFRALASAASCVGP